MMKFLIVDDDLQIARLIQLTLAQEGIDGKIAASAEVAHKLFSPGAFDALIIDAILPGESGVGLANALRDLAPDIPILFCSGATDEYNKQLMWQLGMVCHKPLDSSLPSILRQFIKSFVQARTCTANN